MKRRDGEAKTPRLQEDAAHAMEKETSGQTMPKQTTDVDRLVGIRITALRKARGMSQTALGNAVGVTFQQVQKYEKGINRVGADRLQLIARALNCDVGYFMPPLQEGCAQSPAVMDSFMATKDGVMIAEAFVRIADPEVRRDIAQFVDSLSRRRAGLPQLQAAE